MDQPTEDSSKAQEEAQNSMDVFIQKTLLDFLRDKKGENIAATRTPPNSFARTTMDEMRPLTPASVPSYNRQGLSTISSSGVDLSQIESDIVDISLDVTLLTVDVVDLEERMDVAESDILTLDLDILGLDLEVEDLDERLSVVEVDLETVKTDTYNLQRFVEDDVVFRLDAVEDDILTLDLDILGLDLEVEDLEERLTAVETKLDNMTTLTVQYVSGNSPASATFFVTGSNYPY